MNARPVGPRCERHHSEMAGLDRVRDVVSSHRSPAGQIFGWDQNAAIRSIFDDEKRYWLRSRHVPQMDLEELIQRFRTLKIRFVVVKTAHENRRNKTARAIISRVNLDNYRFGKFIGPSIAQLKPLDEDRFSAVYDGPAVIAELEKLRLERDQIGQ